MPYHHGFSEKDEKHSVYSAEDKADEHDQTPIFPPLGSERMEGLWADTWGMTVASMDGHFTDYLL